MVIPSLDWQTWTLLGTAMTLLIVVAFAPRLRRARVIPGVFGGLATLLTLAVAIAVLPAPAWALALIGAVGGAFIVAEIAVLYNTEGRRARDADAVHRRLDVLDALAENQKTALLKRLYQVQSDVHSLTRAYHVRKSEYEVSPLRPGESAYARALELSGLEGDAVLTYVQKYETEVLFTLGELKRYALEADAEFQSILDHGCAKASDLDGVSAGLHRLMQEVVRRGW
jgi:prepilin signal peptidase PulO-like enzyme (type II secretory pathway)